MDITYIPVLLLDADGLLWAQLQPLCKQNGVDLLSVRDLPRGYDNLKKLLSGGKYSVLLIDESFFGYIYGIGSIRLQQDFPDIEVMMFGKKVEIKQSDTFRFFKKTIDPKVVLWNIKLAARKNQISKRKRRALLTLQKASLNILELETKDDVLKSIVTVASLIMDDTDRTGYFSHLAILNDENHLAYYPQHHSLQVYNSLEKSLSLRIKNGGGGNEVECPAIDLNIQEGGKIGIVGLTVRQNRTQRIDDVKKIPEYIILDESVRSQISVPIKHGDEIFGVLNVEYPEPNAFDENDQFALEALASIIGVAIEQKHLNEKERKQSRALKVLTQIGQWVGESIELNRDQIFQYTVIQAGALMDAKDKGYLVHLALLEGRRLVFSHLHHSDQVFKKIDQQINGIIDLDNPRILDGLPRRGIVGRSVEEGIIQNVPDVSRDPDYIPFSDRIKSQLAVPIFQDDKIIGAINIEHPRRKAFDKQDEENLNSLVLYIGIALRNADLYAQTSKRADHYETVYRAGQMISQHNELQDVVDELAEQVLRIVGDDPRGIGFFSHVSLLDEKFFLKIKSINPSSLPDIYSDAGNVYSMKINLKQQSKLGISGLAFLRGVELNAGDVSKFADNFISIVPGIKSQLSVPIIDGSNFIGVISIESSKLDRFTQEDVEKVKLLARMGAIAIINSRLSNLEKNKTRSIRSLMVSVYILVFTIATGFFLPTIISGNPKLLSILTVANEALQVIVGTISLIATTRTLLSRFKEKGEEGNSFA